MIYREFQIAVSQVNSILKYMTLTDVEKIPKRFRNFLRENSKEEYCIEIRADIPLNKQGLHPKAIDLLGVIYRNYWCEDKNEYDKLLQKNQEKHNEEIKRKYELKFNRK